MQLNLSVACVTGTIWREKSRWLSLNNRVRNRRTSYKVIHNRVSSLDLSQEFDEDNSRSKDLEVMNTIEDYILYIKERLGSIGDGRISVSPYDTAWIALIKDVNGHDDGPQFPSSLEWIAQNQLRDGSWGNEHYFCVYDRLVNTLACVVALRSWNVHADKSEKGISFIKENMKQLENVNAEHMPCGFEIVLPALLRRAQNMGIHGIPYDAPVLTEIYIARDQKMKRIPKEAMHKVRTSLLFSLEGLEDLDWKKLLKLQANDGSFLTSLSSTAFAFMETKDENCFKFIKNTVEKFNGGAPHSYPMDIFGHLWAVDRLQRLGISRYFQSEIQHCLNHVHRYWSDEEGVFSGRDASFSDIDDTSMGFRLLRLHGYDVNPNVFKHFKMENKFSCYGGQMIESSSPIYSLYRASQLLFPGEKILEEAMDFSYKFLQEKLANNQLLDKWVISKNLPDEIRNGLEIPWYSSLPRVETRIYLEHYAGANEVWIGKTLYRMPDISNNAYKELARLDFNRCQAQHQIEWTSMQEWYDNYNIQEFGITRKDLLVAYFLATASIFEPERSKERTAWAKSQIISKMVTYFFNEKTTSWDQKTQLLAEFRNNNINSRSTTNSDKRAHGLHIDILINALIQSLEGFEENISHQLKHAWGAWLMKLIKQGITSSTCQQEEAELHATILNICAGHISIEEILSHPEYKTFSQLTNKICYRLYEYSRNEKVRETDDRIASTLIPNNKIWEIEKDMEELVQLVLLDKEYGTGSINRNVKQTFLLVAKTCYYSAYVSAEKAETHISKVLFEPVI